jgi:hypothetical protein
MIDKSTIDDTDLKFVREIKDLVSKLCYSSAGIKELYGSFNISNPESNDSSAQELRNEFIFAPAETKRFDHVYLVEENNHENGKTLRFFMFEFEEKLLFKNEGKYVYYIGAILDKYFKHGIDIKIHTAIIYGPNVPAIERFPGDYGDLNFHPLRIFLSALKKDEVFATINEKRELGLQFSPLDMLSVLMLPMVVKPFDYGLLRECLTYLIDNKLIDENHKYDFVNIVKALYWDFLDPDQWSDLLKETKMVLYTDEIAQKGRQETWQEAWLKAQQEKMRELAIVLLKKGKPREEVIDILNTSEEWLQEVEKTQLRPISR